MKNNDTEKRLYLDFSASTPVDERVLVAMEPFWREQYANALSNHFDGHKIERVIKEAGGVVAQSIGAKQKEIHFTSGGTESNTWALKGVVEFVEEYNKDAKGLHVIIGAIEHSSVGGFINYANKKGIEVSVVGVNAEGIINVDEIKSALRPETVLVSVLYVNNEIGTIQPIREIAEIIKSHRKNENNFILPNLDFRFPAFHSDASQGFLYLDTNVNDLGVDLLTLDGHKMYGPKGVGVLYIRDGLLLSPMFFSVDSTENKRYGTPPTPLIVGFGKAVEIADNDREEYSQFVSGLRDYTINRLVSEFPELVINGSRAKRLASNISFSFPTQNHEYLAILLDEKRIDVSTKSACRSLGNASHVIRALKGGNDSAIRVSLGKETSKEEMDYFIDTLVSILKKS